MKRREFLGAAAAAAAGGLGPADVRGQATGIETQVAIQAVCAWPNLQRLSDGTIVAAIFNQPCHGAWEGDLDCWASQDGGRTWRFRSRIAAHEPGTARMNCAAGVDAGGGLVVLCSGWNGRGRIHEPRGFDQARVLRAWVCRSSDGGRSWTVLREFPSPPETEIGKDNEFIPFGNLQVADDGSLCGACYVRRGTRRACYVLRSRDGRTWSDPRPLNPAGNETTLLHLGSGRWLAASREFARPDSADVHLELFSSSDDARTWRRELPLTLPGQAPGHLLRLGDGRVLLTYGVRNRGNYGVHMRFSEDAGKTWLPPIRVAAAAEADCGYPSSVERDDGRVVTAFYTKLSADFHYEMRVSSWDPSRFRSARG
jgi:hypothetical protein